MGFGSAWLEIHLSLARAFARLSSVRGSAHLLSTRLGSTLLGARAIGLSSFRLGLDQLVLGTAQGSVRVLARLGSRLGSTRLRFLIGRGVADRGRSWGSEPLKTVGIPTNLIFQ